MNTIVVEKINTDHLHFTAVFALRDKVLRQPLGLSLYNEDTSGDVEDEIFIALQNEKVIGCVMMKTINAEVQKLRQMAVCTDWQGEGIGAQLVRNAEAAAIQSGIKMISLHAREYAVGFYEKLGYKKEGASFLEVNIPHFAMHKIL